MASGKIFQHGDVVWCKCGGLFWPGEVQSLESLPKEIQMGFVKTPKVVVKFFDEDGYEFLLNDRDIHPYNCERKTDFISKGLARAKTKAKEGVTDGWYAKFPKDVVKCEKLTNGNVNILEEEPFVERKEKKIDYSLIFGDQEEIAKKSGGRKGRPGRESLGSTPPTLNGVETPPRKQITHPRFLAGSDHTVRILSQPSTPYHMVGSNANCSPNRPSTPRYTCHICGFAASRVNVIVLHTKSHSEPHKTNLANHARPGMGETRKSVASTTPSRKRLMSPNKAKRDAAKKPRLTKKQMQQKKDEEKGKEEKKKAIFGDWSEDEIEEIEEKEKLKESIANRESVEGSEEMGSDQESIDDMFKFTDDHHSMDSDDDFSINTQVEETALQQKPLRRRKADIESFIKEQEQPKGRKKVYEKGKRQEKEKPSAADAISSLLKSKLDGNEPSKSKKGRGSNKTVGKAKTKRRAAENLEASPKKDKQSLDVGKLLSETSVPTLPQLPEDKSTSAKCPVPRSAVDAFEENFSGSESAGTLGSSTEEQEEPASPPPTRKPGILRKSSHLSIQLPTRPNGNAVVIRHESNSPTKYAAISAKAKAKQLARSAQTEGNKNELASLSQQTKLVSEANEHTSGAMDTAPTRPVTLGGKDTEIVANKELVSNSRESAMANCLQSELKEAKPSNAASKLSKVTSSETATTTTRSPSRTIAAPKKRAVSELASRIESKTALSVPAVQERGEPQKKPADAKLLPDKEETEKYKPTNDSGRGRLEESCKEEKQGESPVKNDEQTNLRGKLEDAATKKTGEALLLPNNATSFEKTNNTEKGEPELNNALPKSPAPAKIESVQNKNSSVELVNQQRSPKKDVSSVKAASEKKEPCPTLTTTTSPKKPSAPQVIQLATKASLDVPSKSPQQAKLVSPPPILPKSSRSSGGQGLQSPKSKPTIITVATTTTAGSPSKATSTSSKSPLAQRPAVSSSSKVLPPSPVKMSNNQVRIVSNPVILPKATTSTVFLQKTTGQQKIMPKTTGNQMIMPKPISRPVLLPKPPAGGAKTSPVLLPKMSKPLGQPAMRSPNSKPTIITVGKSGAVSPTKAAVVQKPILANSPSKPLVMGPSSRLTSPAASLGLDKPVVAGVSRPALGGISLSKPPVVPLVSPHKEPAGEKGLTVSLEPKRPAVVEKSKAPVVKTVELPRRVVEASNRQQQLAKPATTNTVEVVLPTPPTTTSEPSKEVSTPSVVVEGAALGADGLAALSQLQMIGEDGTAGEEMIYLLVDDGTDPNLALENQTLYIDPNQLAAATGGVLTLGSDLGSGHMIIQGNGSTGPLVLQASEGGSVTEGQVLLMMPEMTTGMVGDVLPPLTSTLGLVTSADTSGGIATLPSHPSSSLLAQVPLITTPSQQGPIMAATTKGEDQS